MDNWENTQSTSALKVEEKETLRLPYTIGDFVLSPSGRSATYGACIGIGLGFCLYAALMGSYWLFVPSFGFVFFGVGGLVMLINRLKLFKPHRLVETRTMKPQAPQPTGPQQFPVYFDLENGRSGVTIHDPRPGAFRAWLKSVVNGNGRSQFSRKQAKERGFENYDELIMKLKSVGLLHEKDLYNGAPALTDWGKQKAKDWLTK